MKKPAIIWILTIILHPLVLFGQEEDAIQVLGRATPTSIKLRWGPGSPIAWQYANKYGYTIERITVSEAGKLLDPPVRKILNSTPILPADEREWLEFFDQDDYVGIAAQAIFGESFDVAQESSNLRTIVNKARELENRFGFALYAADLSIKAAELSGLFFEDEQIYVDQKYLYRIYTNVPPDILEIDTGFIFIGMEDHIPLPVIRDVALDFTDDVAVISWNGALFSNHYNTFWVERSDDGGQTFRKITKSPIINTYNGDKPNTERVYRLDSVPQVNKEYHYRVLGINAFGEVGPPSEVVKGSKLPVFEFAPAIVSHEFTETGGVKINWEFPVAGMGLLKSFDLVKQNQRTRVGHDVILGLGPEQRSVIDPKPMSSNYYVILARDIYDRAIASFPYLVQSEDSIPPVPPQGLTGSIDTLGRVYLRWERNKEEDLRGYQLYRANFEDDEQFIQVPGPIIETNEYVDTIDVKNLTEKIYYKVLALDNRFNPSGHSMALELKKPDLIPPPPPVFKEIRSDSTGIFIGWEWSPAEDVVQHLLYRRSEKEADWTLVKILKGESVSFYYDKEVKHMENYAYTMLALDDDQLESSPAVPVTQKWIDPMPYPEIKELFYQLDKSGKKITLGWTYNHPDVERFEIYKSAGTSGVAHYKSVDGDVYEFTDQFDSNDEYIEYQIVASFSSGEKSRFSKKLRIML